MPERGRVYYQEVDVVLTRERLLTVRKTPERGDRRSTLSRQGGLPTRTRVTGMIVYHLVDDDRRALPRSDRRPERRDRRARGQRRGLDGGADHAARLVGACGTTCSTSGERWLRRATRCAGSSTTGSSSTTGGAVFPRRGRAATSPTPTTSSCARATGSSCRATCSQASATTYQAKIANDQNEVMKRLTVIASRAPRPDVHRRPLRPELQHHFPELALAAGATPGPGA